MSGKETTEMKERGGQVKVGRNLAPCDCKTAQQQPQTKKKVVSSPAFHIIIIILRENFSKKCSGRFTRRSHQPELDHTPLPEPVTLTVKGNEIL